MDRTVAEDIISAYERIMAGIEDLFAATERISDFAEQAAFTKPVSKAMTEMMFGVGLPVMRQFPDLDKFDPEDARPHEPTEEDIAQIRASSVEEREAVQAMVLRDCSAQWQKVAKIVGGLLEEFDQTYAHLPFGFLLAVIEKLEELGKIEIVGNPWSVRYSEIRLVSSDAGPPEG